MASTRLLVGLLAVAACAQARADVGPPVKIRMPGGTGPAASAQEYAGVIEILIGGPGQIDALTLEGQGWKILALDVPARRPLQAGDVLRVPFRALAERAVLESAALVESGRLEEAR